MARTYRRCTNKAGNRIPDINLEKEFAACRFPEFVGRYYDLYYYTSDRSFDIDTRNLKYYEKHNRRNAERAAIVKILSDPDAADYISIPKINENPWNWD